MLSKNNFQEHLRKMEQKNEHFSIRKLTVGAASVLIGLTFLGFSGHTVHAAEAAAPTISSTEPKQPDLPKQSTTYNYEEIKPENNTTPKAAAPTSTTTTNPTQPDLPKSGKQPWGVVTDTTPVVSAPPTITSSTNPNIGSTPKKTTYNPEPVVPTITEGTETKTVSRTIQVRNPITDEISIIADQSVTFTRPSYYNEQTKEYTYGEWKLSDGSANFAAVTAPTFEGYTPNVKNFPAETIDPNKTSSKNTTTTISYQKNVTPTTPTPGLVEDYKAETEINLDNLHETTDNSMYPDAKNLISKITVINASTGEKRVIYDRANGIGNLDDVTVEWTNPINTNVDKATMDEILPGSYTATVDIEKNPAIKITYGANSELIKETGNKIFTIQGGHQTYQWFSKVMVQGAKAKNPNKPVQIIAGINDLSSDQIAALIDTTNLDKLTANKPVSYTWATPLKPGDTQGTVKITFSDKDKDGNPTYLNIELPTNSINVVAGIAGTPLTQDNKPAFNGGVAGIPLTQDDKPAFNGGVAGTPVTQDDKPAFNGGVAGIPETQPEKPAFNGGVAGIPETQPEKPAFNGGVAGIPETQPDKPAFNGGVAGIPETQPDLPVAPLPEEPETPTDNNNNVPGQPVDTNEDTVAPHSTENPDNGDNSVETPVVHATEAVKADNTNNGVTAPVHAAAVAHNDEKKENTLPQTGAKATPVGVLGLMLASVGAIFGLAATKKRKN